MKMTKDEILLVLIVLLAFVAGAAAKHYRHSQSRGKPATEAASAPATQ